MPRMASVLAAMAVMAGGQVSFGAVLDDAVLDDAVTTSWHEEADPADLAAWSGLVDEGWVALSPTTDFGFFEEEPEGLYQVTVVDDGTNFRDAISGENDVPTIFYLGGEPLTEQELYDLASQSGVAEEHGDGGVIDYLGGEVEITSGVPEPTALAAALAMATAACAVGRRSRR